MLNASNAVALSLLPPYAFIILWGNNGQPGGEGDWAYGAPFCAYAYAYLGGLGVGGRVG